MDIFLKNEPLVKIRQNIHVDTTNLPPSSNQTIMHPHLIPLQLMPQQASAGPECDWTGVSDPRARKKKQDRIHQRIRRQRKKEMNSVSSSLADGSFHMPAFPAFMDGSVTQNQSICTSLGIAVCTELAQRYPSLDLRSFTACEPDSERTEWFIVQFTATVHQDFLYGSPRTDMLLRLVQFNTTRALVMNARIMGVTSEFMTPDARSQLVSEGIDVQAHNSLPLSLKPTCLQLMENHHPWIDILPFPEIRDNLLRRDETSYDKRELCRDLRGFQVIEDGYGGMVAWKDPWDLQGWEVTQAFASKWPWVIKDCHELFLWTNRWREIRGEPEITM
ncbi:hypothetical protein BKA64DRAFT_669420 [Cadophora sp. MPI-SDFR-AT-0126]|nr:hypothetical protein BKA64DRAFT_669420 [Leotiomycetes sp. MPI-SDFR-AT-0126]